MSRCGSQGSVWIVRDESSCVVFSGRVICMERARKEGMRS